MGKGHITLDHIRNVEKASGRNWVPRGTGRTTAIAFELISQAIKNPGVEIKIRDHHGTHQSNSYLLSLIDTILGKLELQGFELHKLKMCIVFHLYNNEAERYLKEKQLL